MALEGLSISHLGTRFWATTSVDKLKTLVTDNAADVAKAKHLKSIWAGSTRIGSLAQKGETGRFHDVFAAAKAFPKRVADIGYQNLEFLGLQLKENTGIINIDPEDRSIDNFADRIADIFAAKFPELVNNIKRAKVSVRDVLLAVNESVDFTALREGVGNDTRLNGSQLADYKTSLTNATLGALRMIAEKGHSLATIFTLGQKKVYDLSRRYDMYEVAWNAMKDAGLLAGNSQFDVGDGSKSTLTKRLNALKTTLKQKLAVPDRLDNHMRDVATKTLAAINFCLYAGSRERALDKFAAKAHAVLDPLVQTAGGRDVSFTASASGSVGPDVGFAKLTVGGKFKVGRDLSIRCVPGGIEVTTLLGGGLEANASLGFGDVPGAKTKIDQIPGKGEKAIGAHADAKLAGNLRWGHTKLYRNTDDFIAAMKGSSELVESGRFFGFLFSIGRAFRNFYRWLTWDAKKDYEIDQRAFMTTLSESQRDKSPLQKLDGFLSRQKVAVVAATRDFKRIDGGLTVGGGVNIGRSKGIDDGSQSGDKATFSDSRIVDVSASFSATGSRDFGVTSRDYQTVSERYRSLPGTSVQFKARYLERWQDFEEGKPPIDFGKEVVAELTTADRRAQIKAILAYIESDLVRLMKDAEATFAASDGGQTARITFTDAWKTIAVRYELLRRRAEELLDMAQLQQSEEGFPNDVMGQFDEICRYMTSRLDRPDVPNGDTMDFFNEEITNSESNNTYRTTKTSFSVTVAVGTGVGEIASGAVFDEKSPLKAPLNYMGGEGIEKVTNAAAQVLNTEVSVDVEWKTPVIHKKTVPWETMKQQTTTITFPPNIGLRKLADAYARSRIKAAQIQSEGTWKSKGITPFEWAKNEFFKFLGVTETDSILDKPLNEFLKSLDVSTKPQLKAFAQCARTGSLTLTYQDGKLATIESVNTKSSTSGVGVDLKFGLVSFNASVSKTFSERRSSRLMVLSMPLDAMLGRVHGLALATRHQELCNYLAKSGTAALALAREIAHLDSNASVATLRHAQAESVLNKIKGSRKPESEEASLYESRLQTAWARIHACVPQEEDGLVDQMKVQDALATYLEALRDAFAFAASQKAEYPDDAVLNADDLPDEGEHDGSQQEIVIDM